VLLNSEIANFAVIIRVYVQITISRPMS